MTLLETHKRFGCCYRAGCSLCVGVSGEEGLGAHGVTTPPVLQLWQGTEGGKGFPHLVYPSHC